MISTAIQRASVVTALLLLTLACADLMAQEAGAQSASSADSAESIQRLITELASPGFRARQEATSALMNAGDAAIAPLKNAALTGSLEVRVRIGSILKRLEQNSFQYRLSVLKEQPSVEQAAKMPEWSRFAERCGEGYEAIDFYTRLLEAEPKLFAARMNKPAELRLLLEQRAAEVLQSASVRAGADFGIQTEFSVDSYAALLLLASNNEVTLRRATSPSISSLLQCEEFASALSGADGRHYLSLTGAWILRANISVEKPLEFARQFPTEDGLQLARHTLKTALRGQNGRFALMLLVEQGSLEDVPLLESVFDNTGVLVQGTKTSIQYKAYNGDIAMAVAITLRGGNPLEFGFGKHEPRDMRYRFANETIGFETDADREAARQKYAKLFLNAEVSE